MLRYLKFPLLGILFLLFMMPAAGWTDESAGPQAQLEVSVNRLLKILEDKELRQPDKKAERRSKVADEAFSQFNLTRMAMLSLGRGWKKLSPEERREFTGLFRQLLVKSYISTIDKYSGQKVVFTRETVKGDRAEVRSKVISSDREIPIYYKMRRSKNGKWQIYDVIIENVSLVRNYRSQFAPLMKKHGYSGLRQRMQKRIDEIARQEQKQDG